MEYDWEVLNVSKLVDGPVILVERQWFHKLFVVQDTLCHVLTVFHVDIVLKYP